METPASPIPTQPTAVADPAAAAPVVAPPPPVPVVMQTGATTSSGPGWFDGVTLVDVGMFALVSLALFTAIYYYRTQIVNAKVWKSNQQNEIDEVKSNVQAFLGAEYKSFS